MPHVYIELISCEFQKHADPIKAKGAAAYLHNQFLFFGIPTPLRRKICHQFYKSKPLSSVEEVEEIIKDAFQSPYRELHYFAIELLGFHSALWNKKTIVLIEWMLVTNSWWDSVDSLNSFVVSKYFQTFPALKLTWVRKWNRSSNFWLQRSSIIFQLLYKKETDIDLLTECIVKSIHSKEFFIQKAIGWALRQYARTDAKWVKNFVKTHPEMAALSKREALKHIK